MTTHSPLARDTPCCSVIVPVYNGAATIEQCLHALANQSTPANDYELIIVDDGSRDETVARIEAWAAGRPEIHLRLLQQANAGPAAARNTGAQAANAPLLLFTDADCAPAPNWIATMLAALSQPDVAGVKGVYRTQQQAWVARFVQAEYEDRYDRMRVRPTIDFIDTYAAGYRREIFLAQGGFDARLIACEDQELSFRLVKQGHKLHFVPAAWVEHQHVESVRNYARRKFHIGYWKALLTRWHPDRLVQDSHTPQTLKAQMGLAALMMLTTGVGAMSRGALRRWLYGITGVSALAFVGSAAPFLRKLARRSPDLVLPGLGMLWVRAMALGLGFAVGAARWGRHSPRR